MNVTETCTQQAGNPDRDKSKLVGLELVTRTGLFGTENYATLNLINVAFK